jgi:hypothetical protein
MVTVLRDRDGTKDDDRADDTSACKVDEIQTDLPFFESWCICAL